MEIGKLYLFRVVGIQENCYILSLITQNELLSYEFSDELSRTENLPLTDRNVQHMYDNLKGIHQENGHSIYALLPKDRAYWIYKEGEILLATVTNKSINNYPMVSQKLPLHLVNVAKMIIPEELRREKDLFILRASAIRKHNACKIAVWGRGSFITPEELNELFKPYINQLKFMIPYPYFIPGNALRHPQKSDILNENFIKYAWYPAPYQKILKIDYKPHLHKVTLYAKYEDIPLLFWKGFVNAKLTRKLIEIDMEVIPVGSNISFYFGLKESHEIKNNPEIDDNPNEDYIKQDLITGEQKEGNPMEERKKINLLNFLEKLIPIRKSPNEVMNESKTNIEVTMEISSKGEFKVDNNDALLTSYDRHINYKNDCQQNIVQAVVQDISQSENTNEVSVSTEYQTPLQINKQEYGYFTPDEKRSNQNQFIQHTLEKREQIFLRRIKNPDSIVIHNPPSYLYNKAYALNKRYTYLVNSLLLGKVDKNFLLDLNNQIENISKLAWQKLSAFYPFAVENTLENWRHFNDGYDQKEIIVKQKINTNIQVVIPASDAFGMLFTVIKHMCILRRALFKTMNLHIAETLRDTQTFLLAELKDISHKVNSKLQKQ